MVEFLFNKILWVLGSYLDESRGQNIKWLHLKHLYWSFGYKLHRVTDKTEKKTLKGGTHIVFLALIESILYCYCASLKWPIRVIFDHEVNFVSPPFMSLGRKPLSIFQRLSGFVLLLSKIVWNSESIWRWQTNTYAKNLTKFFKQA